MRLHTLLHEVDRWIINKQNVLTTCYGTKLRHNEVPHVHSRSSCVILCSSKSLSHTQHQYATAFEVISVRLEPMMLSLAPSPFPFCFKNTDTPFSSSSSSPFKPDPTPNCTLLTTRSQKQRRHSCSTDLKRRPKKGDHNYVKRLGNAFILFCSKCHEYHRKVQGEWLMNQERSITRPISQRQLANNGGA